MQDARLEALKQAIVERGWRWRPGRAIAYGSQLVIDDGVATATLDFYPKRGRTVVGGPASPLRAALSELAARLEARPAAPAPAVAPAPSSAELGMDESGKGDWFGPLVVAAVYVTPETAPELQRAGVRDSKHLAAGALAATAQAIRQLIPASARAVTVLEPAAYNERYARLGNINLLLAELYAETAAPVVAQTGATRIVCDQFAQQRERLEAAFAGAGLPRPRQMHHAEAHSLAVAAASVLATAQFQDALRQLGAAAGLDGPLPSGAAAIGPLEQAVRQIIAREGAAGLGRYAKLHFKPIQALLAGLPPHGAGEGSAVE